MLEGREEEGRPKSLCNFGTSAPLSRSFPPIKTKPHLVNGVRVGWFVCTSHISPANFRTVDGDGVGRRGRRGWRRQKEKRPHSERFCDVALKVKFYCDWDVAKSLRMGPITKTVYCLLDTFAYSQLTFLVM